MTLHEKLVAIQSSLKAPKGQRNTFGNYNYRSCEDILNAVKPLLKEFELVLTISDDIVEVGGRIYVKATATVSSGVGKDYASVSAFARESEDKKGMDAAQITGAASSYARKYALNGLFCIDDTKDADATNDHGKGEKKAPEKEELDIATTEQKKTIVGLCKDLDKDPLKVMATYCGKQTYWKKEQADKAIKDLSAILSQA